MEHIVVLAGGESDEREVSLRSGAAVAEALHKAGYEVSKVDPKYGIEEQLPALKAADVVFLALHGKGGEDGVLQLFLEEHGIAYVGSGSQASALCFDKARYTNLIRDEGILTPQTETVDLIAYQQSPLSKVPHVLKPNSGGSSIDTFIIRDPAAADHDAIDDVFDRHINMLLQELIEGIEITVGVLGQTSLPVIEIIPPADQEFDYANKYNGATQELCPPLHVSQLLQEHAQLLATQIHLLTGCRDMSRTDIIINGAKLYVLETNTIPGLTNQSLLPKAAAAAGFDMPTVCSVLVKAALAHKST